jgi:hypothetical protein
MNYLFIQVIALGKIKKESFFNKFIKTVYKKNYIK